ncbi:MlaA family lipoprotein [Celerinatantimonas yamalensis]|uniref:VacJ family lipoprotein n=1 Tax=Celerinatantimonas yamalensis TaxID=559956 RepID=A0ABW9G6N2_9GAMM
MLALSGCASHSSQMPDTKSQPAPKLTQQTNQQPQNNIEPESKGDPLESFNRAMWNFDYNYLDKPIYRPIVHRYVKSIPSGGRHSINNFMRNLEEPASMFDNLLQFKFQAAVHNLTRFIFNTTLGMFGFIDVMGRAGVDRNLSDFSDVLGHYGVGDGPFLMLPVAGPSTPRQLTGDVVDQFYFPMAQMNLIEKAVRWTLDGVNRRASVVDQEGLVDSALDPYTFVKNAYLQYRRYRYYDGHPPAQKSQNIDMSKYLNEIEPN